MNFGSPEFYRRLKTEFYSENNWEIHQMLYDEARRVASLLASRAIKDLQLRADAVDDAVCRILTYSIHKFLQNPAFETAGERGRLNWLYRAAANAMRDSLRRANVRASVVLRDEIGDPLRVYHASLDQSDEDGGRLLDTLSAPADDPAERMHLRQRAIDVLGALFSMDSVAPERIVAAACVILHGACGVSFSKKQLNGAVADALSGHTVSENLERIRELLLTLELPATLLLPLERRIASDDPLMSPTARSITRATSDIRVKLRRQFPDNDQVVPFPTATERMDHHD